MKQANDNLILSIGRAVMKIMITDPFYGMFLSGLEKIEDTTGQVQLAAVGLNKSSMEFSLIINPDKWFSLDAKVQQGVLEHEAKHLTSFHLLTGDMYPNHKMDNYATDCEINQTIDHDMLPEGVIKLAELAKQFPQLDWTPLAGRAHYYRELSKLTEEEQEQMGISDNSKHQWEITDGDGEGGQQLSESEKASIQAQMESRIEDLAEAVAKAHGSIPKEIEDLMKGFKKPKPVLNVKKYLRNYVGNSTRFVIKSTKLKENPRFPGRPKVIHKPISRILFLIDESGSVDEKDLFECLNELYHLRKRFDIEIRAFDTEVGPIVKYKGNNEFPRTQCGGTYFTPCIEFYEKSDHTTCIIFTDGHAETPPNTGKNLLWIISSNGDESAISGLKSNWLKMPKQD